MRLLDIINNTASFFQKHGVSQPRLQIELLLAHHLGLKRLELYLQFERVLTEGEMAPLREMVRRRAQGEPLQHITGSAPFYGLELKVTPDTLVPRPETELLVEKALKLLSSIPAPRVIDVGTGPGTIALALATHLQAGDILAVDISENALAVAAQNRERVETSCSVRFAQGDLLQSVEGVFDAVLSNPPYIASGEIPSLPAEVRHDPLLALDGGPDGLRVIERLVPQSTGNLAEGGFLLMEIGHDQGNRVRTLFEAAGLREAEVMQDLNGLDRFVLGFKK